MKSVSRIVSFSLIFLTTSISGGSCVAQIFGGSSKANGFVPPNGHLQMISVDWSIPREHFELVSARWPPNHIKPISEGNNHDIALSKDWPPNHAKDTSKGWPHYPLDEQPWHSKAVSKIWGPGHLKAYSDTFPGSHATYTSYSWPPNHNATLSATPMPWTHAAKISAAWPTPKPDWPSGHAKEVSEIWPTSHSLTSSETWPPSHNPMMSVINTPLHNKTVSPQWPPTHHPVISQSWGSPPFHPHWPPGHLQPTSVTWAPPVTAPSGQAATGEAGGQSSSGNTGLSGIPMKWHNPWKK
jgi:hypothetical protein